MECPECSGNIKIKRIPYFYQNQIKLGDFEAEVCEKCGATYFTDKSFKEIEIRAKLLNIWGRSMLSPKKIEVSISPKKMPTIDAGVVIGISSYRIFNYISANSKSVGVIPNVN